MKVGQSVGQKKKKEKTETEKKKAKVNKESSLNKKTLFRLFDGLVTLKVEKKLPYLFFKNKRWWTIHFLKFSLLVSNLERFYVNDQMYKQSTKGRKYSKEILIFGLIN